MALSRSFGRWVGRTMLIAMAVLVMPLAAQGQTDLPVEKQANLVLELDLDQWRKGPLGKVMPVQDFIERSGLPLAEFQNLDWNSITSLKVLVSLPKDVSSVMAAGMNNTELPLEFMVQVQSSQANAFESFSEMVQNSSEKDEVDGQDFWRPQNGPGNVAAVFPSTKEMRIGTDGFLSRVGSNVISDGTMKAWKACPNGVVRLAADFTGREDFFTELKGFAAMAPDELKTGLEVLSSLASMSAHVDPNGEQLLSLSGEARDSEAAAKLLEMMNMAAEGLRNLPPAGMGQPGFEGVNRLMGEVGQNAKVTNSGNSVTLSVAAPNNFAQRMVAEVFPVMQAAASKVNEQNNMKQIALSMHNYADTYRKFPQFVAASGKVDLSWRVLVLPYIEEMSLFNQLDLDQDWDSQANAILRNTTPKLYGEDGSTRIAAVRPGKQPEYFADITDGTSNTIAFIRLNESIPWAANQDVTIDQVLAMFAAMDGKGSVLVAMYDGSVRELQADTDPDQIRAMLTPDGGEVVNID